MNFSNLFLFLWGLEQQIMQTSSKSYRIDYIYNFYINSVKNLSYFI